MSRWKHCGSPIASLVIAENCQLLRYVVTPQYLPNFLRSLMEFNLQSFLRSALMELCPGTPIHSCHADEFITWNAQELPFPCGSDKFGSSTKPLQRILVTNRIREEEGKGTAAFKFTPTPLIKLKMTQLVHPLLTSSSKSCIDSFIKSFSRSELLCIRSSQTWDVVGSFHSQHGILRSWKQHMQVET